MAISNAQPIQFWPASEDTYNEKEVCGIEPDCYCQPIVLSDTIVLFAAEEMFGTGTSEVDFFTVGFFDSNDVLFFEVGFGTAGYTFFVPSDNGFTAGKYSAKIYNNTAGTGVLYKSDCLDLQEEHDCTGLIKYSNNKDFAGIVYENISPGPELYLRIPMVFFHEDFPQEEEVHPRSDDTWLRLSSRIEKKRMLEIGYVPYYMHEKIQLVLMHDNIEIDGLMWDKRDPYTKAEANKRYGRRKATVWLTDKNYIKRNLI